MFRLKGNRRVCEVSWVRSSEVQAEQGIELQCESKSNYSQWKTGNDLGRIPAPACGSAWWKLIEPGNIELVHARSLA